MWKCPKCGREFKNSEQDHYCVKPGSIDEYIAAQLGKPIDYELITDIVRWRVKQAEGKK